MFTRTLLVTATGLVLLGRVALGQEPRREEAWQIIRPPQSSMVLARDGTLIGDVGSEIRTSVPLSSLPPWLPQAFIAIEDQRFYEHDGVDLVGIAGAIKDALRGNPRGASTITQQLVGNMHPTIIDRSDVSLGRKLREQAAAREMERHYTKDQILEAYLNQVHFGHGWYGIEAAARHYFARSPSQLSFAQGALLAAIINGPGYYDPLRHPDRARQRRDLVLSLMAGQGFITEVQAREAKAEPIVLADNSGYSAPSGYFVDVVRIQAERAGFPVSRGGYRIHTTLDPRIQSAATRALQEGLAEIESQPGYNHPRWRDRVKANKAGRPRALDAYLEGAVVAMAPYTGDVRALVGGRDHDVTPFNRAVDGLRQPGSAFKAFVYATALAQGMTASSLVEDTAVAFPLENGSTYRPRNSDDEYLGTLTLRNALVGSRNPVAVQLGLRFGMDSVADLAHRMGIDAVIAPYPSSAIGASAVQPLDLVSAYAAIGNMGARVEPRFITSIVDSNGVTVWQNPMVAPYTVLDPSVAFILRDMLRDVVDRGTARSIRQFVPESVPVAGKTGTTNDNTDVWFVGMTPDLVAGVWLGFDKPQSIARGAYGGGLAAPIWGRMIALAGDTGGGIPWIPPADLIPAELERRTGELADQDTPPESRYTEYFIAGTEPLPLRLDSWGILRGRRSAVR